MIEFQTWRPASPRYMIKNLRGTPMLVFADDRPTGLVLSARASDNDTVQVTYARTDALQKPTVTTDFDPDMRLGQLAARLFGPTDVPLTIVALPPVKWLRPRNVSFAAVLALVVAAVLTVMLILGPDAFTQMALAAVGAVAASALFITVRPRHRTEIITPGSLHLEGPDLIDHARARLAGESPGSPAQRLAAARTTVDEIREEFGQLTTDIVYRIDYPALFDPAVPATGQFHTALMRFDDAGGLSVAEVEDLAAEVEVAYSLARDHAETVGHRHLPEAARDGARRAGNAARLARGAATEGERTAALTQVQRILESLALYYLPTIDDQTLAIGPPAEP